MATLHWETSQTWPWLRNNVKTKPRSQVHHYGPFKRSEQHKPLWSSLFYERINKTGQFSGYKVTWLLKYPNGKIKMRYIKGDSFENINIKTCSSTDCFENIDTILKLVQDGNICT